MKNARWCGIEFFAVNGWGDYQHWTKDHKVWRDPRLTDKFSAWEFVSREAALSVLAELQARGQKYFLRVIERNVYVYEWLVGGYDIEPGQDLIINPPKMMEPV